MDYLEDFILKLYISLTDIDGSNTNIIRKHTKKLEQLGDLSFPVNIRSWYSLLYNDDLKNISSIFELSHKNISAPTLNTISTDWKVKINRSVILGNKVHLFLDRSNCFELITKTVLDAGKSYGSCNLTKKVFILTELIGEPLHVSELRLKIISDASKNLILFCGGQFTENEEESDVSLFFSLKSTSRNCSLCGIVLNSNGLRNILAAEEFMSYHIKYMRLVAEHKYGIRITSQTGWKEFFEKLGYSSMVLSLLQNKPSSTIRINMSEPLLVNNKGTAFILYNCARLSALFKEFDNRVLSKIYPELPQIEDINFSLLNQIEEWELLYVFVLQFPSTIKSCIRDIAQRKIYPHHLVQHLSGLCLTFSIYYRRVRILTDPRPHLFPTLHAKIYFLKAVEQVLHTGLQLLDIEPVKQM